jgi:SAM-dependent methyltransferase
MSRPASPLRLVLFGLLCLGLPLAGCQTKSSSPSSSSADTSGLSEGERSVLLPGLDTGFKEMLQSDVPFVRTPTGVVDTMLSVANVTADDVVYDLGSGDGRIPIRAAQQYGARGVGIEIDEALVEEARQKADSAGVADRVTFRHEDLFNASISEATVVTLYLLPTINLRVRAKLFEELAPGARVVSHDFAMGDWPHEERVEVDGATLYRWTIPEERPARLQQ